MINPEVHDYICNHAYMTAPDILSYSCYPYLLFSTIQMISTKDVDTTNTRWANAITCPCPCPHSTRQVQGCLYRTFFFLQKMKMYDRPTDPALAAFVQFQLFSPFTISTKYKYMVLCIGSKPASLRDDHGYVRCFVPFFSYS